MNLLSVRDKRLVVACAAFALALLWPAAADAQEQCPFPNSEPYREVKQKGEVTVRCRCIAGYENRGGSCVPSDLKDAPASKKNREQNAKTPPPPIPPKINSCIDKEGITLVRQENEQAYYLVFPVRRTCPDNPIPVSICVRRGSATNTLQRTARLSAPAEIAFARLSESVDTFSVHWSNDGKPCEPGAAQLNLRTVSVRTR